MPTTTSSGMIVTETYRVSMFRNPSFGKSFVSLKAAKIYAATATGTEIHVYQTVATPADYAEMLQNASDLG